MPRPRVLVVEDRPSVLKLVTTVLERGHDVATAASGAEAMPLLRAERFDAVLTDVRMPGATGFDVLRAVREISPRTPVVLMTAYATVPDAVAAVKLGAYDYVAKPLDADELALVVARAVAHGQSGGAGPLAEGVGAASAAPGDVPDVAVGFHEAVEAARDRASRQYLVHLMDALRGNVTHAAARAGITRESLYRLLRRHGVRPEQHRGEPGAAASDAGADAE